MRHALADLIEDGAAPASARWVATCECHNPDENGVGRMDFRGSDPAEAFAALAEHIVEVQGRVPITVHLFCNSGDGTEMQTWYAILETGVVVKSHLSSSREWGIHDTSPESGAFTRDAYDRSLATWGLPEFDLIDWTVEVAEPRATPPAEILARNAAFETEEGDGA